MQCSSQIHNHSSQRLEISQRLRIPHEIHGKEKSLDSICATDLGQLLKQDTRYFVYKDTLKNNELMDVSDLIQGILQLWKTE